GLGWYERAITTLESIDEDDPRTLSAVLDNMGICYFAQAQYDLAREKFEAARRVLEAATPADREGFRDLSASIVKNLSNLSMTLIRVGRRAEAERRALELLDLCERGGRLKRAGLRGALVILAEIRGADGRAAEALEYLLRAAEIADDEIGEVMSLGNDAL